MGDKVPWTTEEHISPIPFLPNDSRKISGVIVPGSRRFHGETLCSPKCRVLFLVSVGANVKISTTYLDNNYDMKGVKMVFIAQKWKH